MKKKFFAFIIALTAIFAYSQATFSDYTADVVVQLQINNPIMQVNGTECEIDAGRGTTPVVSNDRTLVPIRAIIEAFGGTASWDGNTQSVFLSLEDDTVKLIIDSDTAYINDRAASLDTAPSVINDRTMLPLRFIAESFNLGVAWDGNTQSVYVIRNYFEDSEYSELMSSLPPYSGQAYTVINNNVPYFEDYEIISGSFEYYSKLDEFGRCDVCFASVAPDLMPTEKRGDIGSVTPTGWINVPYDNVDGGYLYNRCHLIGFQLTGENANERNLITGTRYMNVSGMLPFENEIADYIDATGNHVMYRSTPVFTGSNLVADGVLLEAYSVEDNGNGISFCVYCYNVQPQINIDYATGASSSSASTSVNTETSSYNVYRTPSGKRYHTSAECGGKNSFKVTKNEAVNAGLTPCSKCCK